MLKELDSVNLSTTWERTRENMICIFFLNLNVKVHSNLKRKDKDIDLKVKNNT